MAEDRDRREESGSQMKSMAGAISDLPLWMWGLAGLLAVAPAVGLHLIVAPLARNSQASFIFFYWLGALYFCVRKAATFEGVVRRTIILLACEAGIFLLIKGARLLG